MAQVALLLYTTGGYNHDGENMLETFTLATFTPRINDAFRISLNSAHLIDVTLIDASSLGDPTRPVVYPRTRMPFSLTFRGPLTPVLPQHIYHLEHADIGGFDIFLVPIGPDHEGMRYEAIFG